MKICVFCGASTGLNPKYTLWAKELMQDFSKHNIELVYGGSDVGIMGILADQLLSLGGKVTGVIPENLSKREIAHKNLTNLHVVSSMHERKDLMYKISDMFFIFPGGMGTLDEFFEILTWKQLGLHNKKIYILNFDNYYENLIKHLHVAGEEGFFKEMNQGLYTVLSSLDDVKTILNKEINI
jgi:uncharacterized protein (TIGR00730 family)